MKKLLLLCSLLCLAILEIYGQKQPNAMVHDEIFNGYIPERLMDKDSLFMRRHIQGSMMSGKMAADRAELPGRHNMEAEQRLTAVKKVDKNSTKGDGTFVEQSDSLALVALYNSTNGPGWSNSTSWLTGPVSTWYGVEVFSGKVHSVDLNSNGLSGTIPPEIGSLTGLQYLYLDHNQLSGAIPPEIGSLTSLQYLGLWDNQLSGAIPPEIGSLTSLQILDLDNNQLSGAIPPEIGSLTSLQILYIDGNQLSGAIPPEIGNLTSLLGLYLMSNQLSGAIPTEIGSLTSLQNLYLAGNQLSGAIPPEIGSLTSLQILDLDNNQLSGAIPPEIGNLTSLLRLYLYNNQLSGAIPPEIGSLTSLQYLNLGYNQLSGAIPPEIGSLTSLQYLYLNSNLLSDLPDLSAIANLNVLAINNNQFTFSDLENTELNFSAIPSVSYSPQALLKITSQTDNGDGTSTLSFTTDGTGDAYQWFNGSSLIENATTSTLVVNNNTMGIYYCKVTNPAYPYLTLETKAVAMNTTFSHGVFEDEYNVLVELYNNTGGNSWISKYSWLSNNDVDEWYGVEVSGGHVTSINLYNNNLAGTIPSSIGNLASLQYLDLRYNQLSGAIPPEIGSLTSLQYLILGNNQLSGAIPPEIGSLTSLQYLWLWDNQLSGAIPPEIGSLSSLQSLSLGDNQLSGAIPPEIGSLTSLQSLNLGNNQLSGAIPHEIGNLTNLLELYLYNNQLSGAIPPEIGSLSSLQYLYLNSNLLSDLPDLSASLSLSELNASNNHLTFEDIEPNLSGSFSFYYSPQARVGSVQHYTPGNGDSLDISVSVGGANNTYQWLKDGADILGATGATHSISSYSSLEHAGVYVCRIQNSMATELTLESYCIYVGVDVATYTVDVSASPVSSGTVSGGGTYEDGQTATVSATPNTGYRFGSWTSNGTEVSTSSTYTFVVTSDTSLVANFEPNTYAVSATPSPAGSGTVTGAGTYSHGASVSLVATPNTGYRFVSWTSNGTGVSTSSTYTFVVTSDTSLVANFELNTYAVSATPSPAGSGTVTGAGTYSHGASVSLVATPNTGYRFVSWTSNDTVVSTSSTYTFVVTSDTSLVANFENIDGIIEDGLKESISIYPNPTNRLITVSGEGADVKSVAVYDFMGRLIGHYNVNTAEATVDFTGYPSGAYLVVVQTNRGIFTRKIVRE